MAVVNKQPVLYYQTDPRWKNVDYSARGEKTTIGASGCGPTSMAMVLATWADPAVTPLTECKWALAHGWKCPHSGTYYGYFVKAAERYGLVCTQLNGANIIGNASSPYHAQAKAAVDRGDLVIACMGKGTWTRSGHYIVVWGIDGNTVYINDPASSRLARTRGDYSVFKRQVKYYWVIRRPASKPLTPTYTTSNANYDIKTTDREGLNCRKGPGISNEVVIVYPYGTIAHISKVTNTGWGQTDKGWIYLASTARLKEDELNMNKAEFLASLTPEEAYDLVSKALNYMGSKHEPTWSKQEGAWAEAQKKDIINGGAPERPIKRDEVIAILHRLGLI